MKTICYKLNEAVVYNKGTDYEKTCDTFLHCYFGGTDEELEKVVADLNKTATDRVYFGDEQEMFDTRD